MNFSVILIFHFLKPLMIIMREDFAASENMMEIGKHLNRRDMKQIPPSGLSRRDSLRWLAYGDKGQYWSPSDTLKGGCSKILEIPNLYKRLFEMCCWY